MEILIVPIFALIMMALQPSPVVDRVTLLPDAQGKAGAVIVSTGAQQHTLDTAFATLAVRKDGEQTPSTLQAEAAHQRFGDLLAQQPKAATSFMLYFLNGQDTLTEESVQTVRSIQTTLDTFPAPQISVIGHTDRVGTQTDNDALSIQRAEKVRALLIEYGLDANIIEAQGRGEREPLVPTDDEVAEPKNRRAEVNIR